MADNSTVIIEPEGGGYTIGSGEDAPVIATAADMDTLFVLGSGYLVFFMQCGFAMLSVGSVRTKNAKNIILKNLLDACFGAICFYLIGYGFAYGGEKGNENSFIGWGPFALNGESRGGFYSWFFQFAFAATAATIVSGAVAERCKFEGYIAYAILLTSWVYPVVAHWAWSSAGWASAFKETGDGPLWGTGVVDFAGCGVVHMVGGLAAFAGAWAIGPRYGRFTPDGDVVDMPGHNAALAILGVFILWFGWFGFNPGSALAIIGFGPVAALCAITTTISAAAATLTTLFLLLFLEYRATGEVVYDLIGCSNGTLAGLVGITSATSVVEPWGALLIGIISGFVYVGASKLILHGLKIDDPLDAAAVHGACGIWGLIAAGLFASKEPTMLAYGGFEDYGLLLGGGGKLLGAAIVFALAVAVWVLGHMIPFFYLMKKFDLLRVDRDEEKEGLDISHHGGSAYETDQMDIQNKQAESFIVERVKYLERTLAQYKKEQCA